MISEKPWEPSAMKVMLAETELAQLFEYQGVTSEAREPMSRPIHGWGIKSKAGLPHRYSEDWTETATEWAKLTKGPIMDRDGDHFILTRDRLPLPDTDSKRFEDREAALLGAFEVSRRTLKPVIVTRIRTSNEWTDVACVVITENDA